MRGAICVWSGRTPVAPSFYWRYVAVRRPADYLENSVSNGLQWSVFEPNDARFWARIREPAELVIFSISPLTGQRD